MLICKSNINNLCGQHRLLTEQCESSRISVEHNTELQNISHIASGYEEAEHTMAFVFFFVSVDSITPAAWECSLT